MHSFTKRFLLTTTLACFSFGQVGQAYAYTHQDYGDCIQNELQGNDDIRKEANLSYDDIKAELDDEYRDRLDPNSDDYDENAQAEYDLELTARLKDEAEKVSEERTGDVQKASDDAKAKCQPILDAANKNLENPEEEEKKEDQMMQALMMMLLGYMLSKQGEDETKQQTAGAAQTEFEQ